MMVWKQKHRNRSWRVVDKKIRVLIFGSSKHKHFLAIKDRFVAASRLITLAAALIIAMPALAFAGGLTSSTNYQLGEAVFSSGGQLNSCSSNYCSKQAAGELAAGTTSSPNFQAHAGFNTDRTPYIQINVSNTNTNLGTLTPTTTATTTASFSVESYLSQGYAVINGSGPPTNGSYTMLASNTPTTSNVGTEQFGMNLVANTFPATFGNNPVFVPDSTFSFGQVTTAYDTPNMYLYNQGDMIAFSSASTSFTTYTISYIFNISHVTPGGTYTFYHVLVATGTY
jgi:hypothetical protein